MLYQRVRLRVYSKGLRNSKHLLTVITWNGGADRQDEPWSTAMRTFDVTSARAHGARRHALTFAVAATLGHAAGAQLLDSTLDEVVNDAIDEQVEQQLDSEISEAISSRSRTPSRPPSRRSSSSKSKTPSRTRSHRGRSRRHGNRSTADRIGRHRHDHATASVDGRASHRRQSRRRRRAGLEDVLETGSRSGNGLGQVVEGVGEAAERAVGGADAAAEDGVAGGDRDFVRRRRRRGTRGRRPDLGHPRADRARRADSGLGLQHPPAAHADRFRSRAAARRRARRPRHRAGGSRLGARCAGTTVDFNHVYTPGADDAASPAVASRPPRPRRKRQRTRRRR